MWLVHQQRRRWLASTGTTVAESKRVNFAILRCKSAAEINQLVLSALASVTKDSSSSSRFNAINCVTALRQMSMLNSTNSQALTGVLQLSSQHQFDARQLTTLCHSLAKQQQQTDDTVATPIPPFVIDQINTRLGDFTTQGLITTLWAFARTKTPVVAVVNKLAAEACSRSGELKPEELSSAMWALSTFNLPCEPIEQEVLLRSNLSAFSPKALTNILHSSVTSWGRHRSNTSQQQQILLVQRIAREVVHNRQLADFSEQELANICHSLAKFDNNASSSITHELFDKICSELIVGGGRGGKTAGFFFSTPQPISNVLWALATVGHRSSLTCYERLADALLLVIDSAHPQNLSNAVWALAKLVGDDGDAAACRRFHPLCTAVYARTTPKRCSPQAIANTLWGFAKLGYVPFSSSSSSSGFARLSREMVRDPDCLKAYSAQHLANIAWALGTLRVCDVGLLDAISNAAEEMEFSGFGSHSFGQLVFAHSALRVSCPKFISKVCDAVVARAMKEKEEKNGDDNGEMSHLTALTVSLASMAMPHPGVIELAATCAVAVLRGAAPDTSPLPSPLLARVVNLMWAFACLDVLHDDNAKVAEFFQMDLVLPSSPLPASWDMATLASQLAQISIACKQAGGMQQQPSPLLHAVSSQLLLPPQPTTTPSSSSTHLTIAEILRQRGEEVQMEATVVLDGGSLVVDMLLPGHNVVIEVDGPTHFFNDGTTPTGKTLFKRRLLERAGLCVVSLPARLFALRRQETSQEQGQRWQDILTRELNTALL